MTDQLPERLDVIAVGAHPDDVEIGCGGTLAKLVDQGCRVGIIDITYGEPTPLSSGPKERLAEASKAAACLGVVHREQLGFPNRKLFDCFDVRVALAKVFRRYRPRLVLGIGDKTPMASPDHAQAMMITEAAVFYSRLTKWDDVFDNLPEYTIPHLLTYFLFTGVADLPAGCWPIIVNIEGHLKQKMEAIHCYASQFPPEKKHVFTRVGALSQTVGFLGGCAEGELLAGSRIPCTTDLMRLL